MRLPVRCLEISSIERSTSEMARIGVDPAGIRIMAPKHFHYNIKVEGLTPAQANVLKQDALAIGGEAAVAKGAASCSVASSDAILSGTRKQFDILIEKLKVQCFGLPEVAEDLRQALDNVSRRNFIIRCRSRQWHIGPRTLIMGVLNVTPDSFSDGGAFLDKDKAAERGLEMVSEGADWIDVGGESSRPGAEPVDAKEETWRVVPVVEALAKKGVTVSVDTAKASVARAALDAGAEIINDISALSFDPDMAGVCASYKAPVILMHMRGTPRDMQKETSYGDITGAVYNHLLSRIEAAVSSGIERENIIIDPGIGFGKSMEGNFTLLKNLAEFKTLGRPILIGASRKSFIGPELKPSERLAGTLAASALAILNGASIIRVHDVKEALQAARTASSVRDA